jgi:hypothetical protein
MTPQKDWFFEYEKYNGGDAFLVYDLIAKIIRHRRVKVLLKNRRIGNHIGVLQIYIWPKT